MRPRANLVVGRWDVAKALDVGCIPDLERKMMKRPMTRLQDLKFYGLAIDVDTLDLAEEQGQSNGEVGGEKNTQIYAYSFNG